MLFRSVMSFFRQGQSWRVGVRIGAGELSYILLGFGSWTMGPSYGSVAVYGNQVLLLLACNAEGLVRTGRHEMRHVLEVEVQFSWADGR